LIELIVPMSARQFWNLPYVAGEGEGWAVPLGHDEPRCVSGPIGSTSVGCHVSLEVRPAKYAACSPEPAGGIIKHRSDTIWNGSEWRMNVTDEAGRHVSTLRFAAEAPFQVEARRVRRADVALGYSKGHNRRRFTGRAAGPGEAKAFG
jgi:hypothetical protein